MTDSFEQRLKALMDQHAETSLKNIVRGMEKESLRITSDGRIAQTDHPKALGSTLTHPAITTDYSEALLEFITSASTDLKSPLQQLDILHRYTYANIGNEILWTNSMPCVVGDDKDVRIAEYGSSNVGMMKHIYRRGLDYRYGRKMQAIAGIHYNFSFPQSFWKMLQAIEDNQQPLQVYINQRYFDLLRNFLRYSWLLVYLFGASPAVCASFLSGRKHQLLETKGHTLTRPFATSLRMSDLGYQNNAQSSLHVSVNNLEEYVRALTYAIQTPEPSYQDLGIKVDGEYRQLNGNILQIENEYYSSIRPKRTSKSGERPTLALQRRGVEYIEMRVLDLNPFEPLGISQQDIRFLDLFATYCVLQPSPLLEGEQLHATKQNIRQVVYNGRDVSTQLAHKGKADTIKKWGNSILDNIQGIAELFDRIEGNSTDNCYQKTVTDQKAKLADVNLTPSAKVMNYLKQNDCSFYQFAMKQSQQHRDYFINRPLSDDETKNQQKIAQKSLDDHAKIEAADQIPFEDYLAAYFKG
jgi:glutamate--cysteine ligase